VTRRKQVGYKLLDIPLDNAHNFRAAAHNLANRCEPDELQYLQRIAMMVVEQTRADIRITHATQAKRANRLRTRIDRLTQRRLALSTATRGGAASTWRLVNRRNGTVIFEGDPGRVELYAAELERRYKRGQGFDQHYASHDASPRSARQLVQHSDEGQQPGVDHQSDQERPQCRFALAIAVASTSGSRSWRQRSRPAAVPGALAR